MVCLIIIMTQSRDILLSSCSRTNFCQQEQVVYQRIILDFYAANVITDVSYKILDVKLTSWYYQHRQIARKFRQGFFYFANRNLFFQGPLEAQPIEKDYTSVFSGSSVIIQLSAHACLVTSSKWSISHLFHAQVVDFW